MCVVSNVMDEWNRRWPQPPYTPYPAPAAPTIPSDGSTPIADRLKRALQPEVTRDDLKRLADRFESEIEKLREELLAAKQQDIAEGNPDCESADKIAEMRRVADSLGHLDEINEVLAELGI